MGKQSRKKTSSKKKEAAAATTTSTAEREISDNGSWSQLKSVAVQGASFIGKETLVSKLGDVSIPLGGVWRVYIRRLNWWFGTELVKKKKNSPRATFRSWWVSFILVPLQRENDNARPTIVSGWVQDDLAVTKDPTNHPLTPSMFMAVLSEAIDVLKSRPRRLVFWPAAGGAFRLRSIHSLMEKLRPMVPKDFNLEALKAIEPSRENVPDSCCLSALTLLEDRLDPDVELFLANDSSIVKKVEHHLEEIEDRINRSNKHRVPGIVEKLKISILDLRRVSLHTVAVFAITFFHFSVLLLLTHVYMLIQTSTAFQGFQDIS